MNEINHPTYLVLGIIAGRAAPTSFNEIEHAIIRIGRAVNATDFITTALAVQNELDLLVEQGAITYGRPPYTREAGYMLAVHP